jgi:hypothetical protein
MANPDHLQILQQGVKAWNAWRDQHTDIEPDLGGAALYRADLRGATLHQWLLTPNRLHVRNCDKSISRPTSRPEVLECAGV